MFLLIVFRINPFKCCCKCKSKNEKLLDEHLPIINDVFIDIMIRMIIQQIFNIYF